MRQNMHGIIFISKKIGYPDIFFTMTRSSQLLRIKNVLLPRQSVTNRFEDYCTCIRTMLLALMAFVTDEQVFGEKKAHTGVSEFEKRGLPHARCIFFMTPQLKTNLLNPAFIDTIISAEIPAEQNSLQRQVILKHNIHNPCGHLISSAVCMIDNLCSKQFLKTWWTKLVTMNLTFTSHIVEDLQTPVKNQLCLPSAPCRCSNHKNCG